MTRKINSYCLIFFLLAGFSISSHAQFARVRHLTVEDGLSQNYVSCFAQDKKGFIWIGTPNGLNKYDGIKITVLKSDPEDTNSLHGSHIRYLYPDNEDNLWGGTSDGGLFKINLQTQKITNYLPDSANENSIGSKSVSFINEYEPGKLYISTLDGLNIFDKRTGKFTVYKKGGKNHIDLLNNNLRYTSIDKDGNFWFGHPNAGVTRFDPRTKKCKHYTDKTDLKLPSNTLRAIFCDSKGLVWISCWAYGSCIIDTRNNTIHYKGDTVSKLSRSLKATSLISQFYEDKKGNILFATAENGLGRSDTSSYETVLFENNKDDPETINDNTVFSIFEDKSGLIWCGTWKGGVNIVDPRTLNFGYFKHESNKANTLINNSVFSFTPKSGSEIYVGTGGGLSIFNYTTKTFSQFPIDERDGESLRHNSIILGAYTDDDGSIWVLSFGAGVYRYYPNKNKYHNYVTIPNDTNSLSYHTPRIIVKDKKGRLWIGTEDGLNLYNPGKDNFTHIPGAKDKPPGFGGWQISDMVMDETGKLWIATSSGIAVFDPDIRRIINFYGDNVPLFKDIAVTDLCLGSKGRLWIASMGDLLSLNMQTGEAVSYKNIHPVFSSLLCSVLEDDAGQVWFTNQQGMCRFDPVTKKIALFTTANGLQGKQFNYTAACKTFNGKLFFGGLNGFNVFDPAQISLNTLPPQVVLTGFSVLNKPFTLPKDVAYTDEITLSYKNYFFEFDFAALDFTNPEKNTYEYKLEGFNDNWVHIGTENSVTFTNLDPGTYTLLIKAANSDGFWGEPLKIKITITPPFWKTLWFYLFCIVTAGFIIYGYIKWRERQLQQEKTVLENKVEARTAELKIEKQKVEAAHKDIKDSINYAKRIQEAILPEADEIKKHLREYFILYKPKDIVAGDFYWFYPVIKDNITDGVLIAAADCTGHGVPGAFMSMIGSTFLNEIVKKGIYMPDKILNELNVNIRKALKQNTELSQSRDGMDIVLCYIDLKDLTLYYAGANRPCVIVSKGELKEIKADKFPIGGLQREREDQFTLNKASLSKGDHIYLFSDGYADQFGGATGKKFMYRQLKDLLLSISNKPLPEQKELLDKNMTDWKGNVEQIDDILVIGVRL